MAISAVTIADCTLNGSVAITKDAFDTTEGHEIDVSDYKSEKLVVLIETTNTETADFNIKAGVGAQSVIGDLTVTRAAEGIVALDLETARFKNADGKILIDITTGGTPVAGSIMAIAKS
jgi:ethanolamine utilization microcompartment shell protein EutS